MGHIEEGTTKNSCYWKVYLGDALENLRLLPDECVDCVVTSPPYFWLRDYGNDRQIGQEQTVKEYVEKINEVMLETKRVLKKTGVVFVNIGDTYYSGKGEPKGDDRKSSKRRFGLRAVDKSGGLGIGIKAKSLIGIPWRVALRMLDDGWILRSSIIWYRKHSLPEAVKDRPKRSYENVFMFSKSKSYFFNRHLLEQEEQEDMWTITARPKNGKIQTAPYPDELALRCIEIGSPEKGTILDPFSGSGTTLRVALEMNRNAIGIELNKSFYDFIVNNLNEI